MGETELIALYRVNLIIETGSSVAIVGPSGSGKTTLLRIIGALDTPTEGSVCVDGVSVDEMDDHSATLYRREKVGFVFQTHNLLPYLTALENVELPMYTCVKDKRRRASKARELLESVGLGDKLSHLPSQLSGGEQQRTAIARALANSPSVLLADEPTGQLDSITGSQVVELLVALVTKRGGTLLLATHNSMIERMMGRVVRLHDGRLV